MFKLSFGFVASIFTLALLDASSAHARAIAKDHAKGVDRELRKMRGRISRGCKNFWRGAERKFNVVLARRANRRHDWFDSREAFAFSSATRLQKALYRAR